MAEQAVETALPGMPGGTRAGALRTAVAARLDWVRDPAIAISSAVLLLMVLACFLWPVVYPVPEPVGGSLLEADLPAFSPGHLLGTNAVGNDLLSRCLYGGRVSMEIAAASVLIGLVLGAALGIAAVFLGGIVDTAITRLIDMIIAFPALVLFLVIADGLGPSKLHVIYAISVFTIPAFARIARAATMEIRGQVFVLAHELSGCRRMRLVLRHVVPNIMPQLVTFCCLLAGIVILISGALSFLGLGVPPPTPSWGNLISDGQKVIASRPLLALVPSAFLFVTALALNLLGDGLRGRWGVE